MWKLLHPIYNFWRRYFGSYSLDDPRPIQKEAPYTYFLPTQWQLENLDVRNLVKLNFRSHPAGIEWDSERMWVEITTKTDGKFIGVLANNPNDIPQLKRGAVVNFESYQVVDTDRADESGLPKSRQYWERCLVDKCVTIDGTPIHFLYREEPDEARVGDKFPDSGWRIRGEYRDLSDEEIDAREMEYVALGRVLNSDDSWLHLISAPIGAAYIRDFASGKFVPEERVQDDDD